MIGICIILCLWAVLVTVLYIGQRRHIRSLNKDIKEVCETGGRHRVLLKAPDKELEALLKTLNDYIEQCQEKQAEFRRKDADFKHQVSNISHDLRTPLTSILGYVQLIKREYEAHGETCTGAYALHREDGTGEYEKHVMEYLEIIERKAEMLKNLISQFYDLSRLEGSEYKFQMEAVDLSVLMSQIMADEYDELEKKNFRVDVSMASGRLLALADAKAMSRVYANLIQNVLKHGRDFLSVHIYASEDTMVTEIANQTEPVSDDELAHLFDRFFTTDRMRSGQNTGLGLAIVQQFIIQMGGKISAAYEDGMLKFKICMRAV